MADSQTVRGRITFIVRREGKQPIEFEFNLRLAEGSDRLVRAPEEMASGLREGAEVEAVGPLDTNGVLVATSVRPVAARLPPPPAPAPWLWLAAPALAAATLWLVVYTIQEDALPRSLWIVAAVLAIAVGFLKAVNRPTRFVLRTIGITALLSALWYEDQGDAFAMIAILLLLVLLSVVTGIVAVVLLVRRYSARRAAAPGAPARS
jgi:hypothetical protein